MRQITDAAKSSQHSTDEVKPLPSPRTLTSSSPLLRISLTHSVCVIPHHADDATHFFCILYFNPCGSEAVNLKLWFILSPSFVCGVPLGRRLWSEHLGCVCQEVDAVDASGGHLWKFPLFKFGNCYSFISPAAKKKKKFMGEFFFLFFSTIQIFTNSWGEVVVRSSGLKMNEISCFNVDRFGFTNPVSPKKKKNPKNYSNIYYVTETHRNSCF